MDIDPVKYGVMWERVQNNDRRFDDISKKIDKMEGDIEQLLALANQAKGGVQVGKIISGIVGGAIAFVADWLFRK
ncbi:hypothetical protein UFOVP830_20 [uncultured Caudovirales phage]|jgi:hypothetical protein|uniref:Uncharacterized protein n=1 Tax=uncultured Caudovirales phage TaxID=2100421 RepID=A0A6J5P4P9_9CAUD|nr:hypothetical protein UFOVP830_20 [uncultured Caudovirales phage]